MNSKSNIFDPTNPDHKKILDAYWAENEASVESAKEAKIPNLDESGASKYLPTTESASTFDGGADKYLGGV